MDPRNDPERRRLLYPTEAKVGIGGGPTRATVLPEDPAGRKQYPIATGVLDYFPDAIAAIAHLSWKGNEQHNPGQPLHWARGKSTDEEDTLMRHFVQRGTVDKDGIRHSVKVAWRALALLQKELEEEAAVRLGGGVVATPLVPIPSKEQDAQKENWNKLLEKLKEQQGKNQSDKVYTAPKDLNLITMFGHDYAQTVKPLRDYSDNKDF